MSNRLGCLTLSLSLLLAVLLPVLFSEAVQGSLRILGLPLDIAGLVLVAALVASAINVPLWNMPTQRYVITDPLATLGLAGLLPHLETRRKATVVAVNVGGCLIPLALAVYQVVRLATASAWQTAPVEGAPAPNVQGAFVALVLAMALNIIVCWKLTRVVPGVGITVPGIVPGILAAAAALLLSADVAPAVTLVAGTLGPLVGADLLHLRDLKEKPVGLQSFGGAGTFDAVLFTLILSALVG